MPRTTSTLLCLLLVAGSAATQGDGDQLALRYAAFDPRTDGPPAVPLALRADAGVGLWIAQLHAAPDDAVRAALSADAEIVGWLPERAYLLRAPRETAARIAVRGDVRWLGPYEPAYRIEPRLCRDLLGAAPLDTARYRIVLVDKRRDEPALTAAIHAHGGRVVRAASGGLLVEAELDGSQVLAVARLDQVLWVERWTPVVELDDDARVQGGADSIETLAGYDGTGIRGHNYESLELGHPDWSIPPTQVGPCFGVNPHGHATAGVIFGNGTSSPTARGIAPGVTPYFTDYCTSAPQSRWQIVEELVDVHQVMFTSASWTIEFSSNYTAASADADDIVFDHDIPWTQSHGNEGTTEAASESWAKNVISVGGVDQRDNADPTDDSWSAGSASIGPASDGRIKPDLAAYYRWVATSDPIGFGYTSSAWNQNFGGTSAAAPIVAGYVALLQQMYTDGLLVPLRNPGASRFTNRPHAATVKAIQLAHARQYPFGPTSTDNRREHVGWGFPDIANVHKNAGRSLVVDETDVLRQGESTSWTIDVQPGDAALDVCLTWLDPPANPAAATTLVNDLTLRVTSPSGVTYYGNAGLTQGNVSIPIASPDTVDSVENVRLVDPAPGTWTLRVSAVRVALDGHVETPAFDVDYALCATLGRTFGAATDLGPGCPGSGQKLAYCEASNPDGGRLRLQQVPKHQVAIKVPLRAARTITGFRLWTKSWTRSVESVTARLYLDGGGVPALLPMRSGSMTVGVTEGFYETSFAPLTVSSGSVWIAIEAEDVGAPSLTVGDESSVVIKLDPGDAWAPYAFGSTASYHLICDGAGVAPAAPELRARGLIELGRTVRLDTSLGAPSAPGAMLLGASSLTWGAVRLPVDLAFLGAPGCRLRVSPDLAVPFLLGVAGEHSLGVPLPMDVGLVGAEFSAQPLVVDPPANAGGLVSGAGLRLTIGR